MSTQVDPYQGPEGLCSQAFVLRTDCGRHGSIQQRDIRFDGRQERAKDGQTAQVPLCAWWGRLHPPRVSTAAISRAAAAMS